MQGSKRDTDIKNRLLDFGIGKGGMIWENITETCILPYVKEMTRASSMHDAGYSKPVLWGNLEECCGEEVGGGFRMGGSNVHRWLIHVNMWQKPQYCKAIILSHVWLFVTPWTAARQASLSITITQSLLKLMSIKSVMPSNHLILRHPLLLLPSIFPSTRVFSNESVLCMKWPKY